MTNAPSEDSVSTQQSEAPRPRLLWADAQPLAAGEVFVLTPEGASRDTAENAKRQGLLVVDLSDDWAPFIFSETNAPGMEMKPNAYRKVFVALANDRVSPDELFLESPAGRAAVLATVPAHLRSATTEELSLEEQRALERARSGLLTRRTPNFLEVFGIPPTLSVLAKRVADDMAKECYAALDLEGLRTLDFEVSFQSREQATTDYAETVEETDWLARTLASLEAVESPPLPDTTTWRLWRIDPKVIARLDHYRRGQAQMRAVREVQARLSCEGLLSSDRRYTPGAFDLPTHEALAEFEKKHDIFGWGFVSGETQEALLRSPTELHLETFRRILAERLADAAGIVEDGSTSKGEAPTTYTDASGELRPVPNLIGDFVDAGLQAMRIETPEDLAQLFRTLVPQGLANFRVAFQPPVLPPYYAAVMDLSAEIERGDVWYDFPFDKVGRPIEQRRRRYPTFTLFVTWNKQKIPLVRWRTTIGSWRSELRSDGRVYLKYKNSDVGPRIWKDIVAAPVWVPPAGTPGKDLLVKKVFDRKQGPVTVVNTEVMGPGFASAYGLVMAIHLEKLPDGGLFDNQIRTHGSVDYTSIARRFSHGCHRLVNNRAVRLFDFLLSHRKFKRLGNRALKDFRRKFEYQGQRYDYKLDTRGYDYELRPPLPLVVLEGRIMGRVREPIADYVRKPGVDYGPLPADSPVEPMPVLGP